MIKKSILILTDLGGAVRYLRERQEGALITHKSESELHVTFVQGTIEGFLESITDFGLFVTLRAADELREFLDNIKDRDIGSVLTKVEAGRINEIMISLENTFSAEAKGIHSFFTTDKQISMDKLTVKPEGLLPKGDFSELPEIAKYDVREAGMCIAFERSTAVAFHILRATEEVLREYYCRIVKQKRVIKLTWGNITNDLEKKRKKPSAIIMKNLEYIRDNFRNPTAHPEARYDIVEAQSLFNLCVDVMSRMIRDSLWKKK